MLRGIIKTARKLQQETERAHGRQRGEARAQGQREFPWLGPELADLLNRGLKALERRGFFRARWAPPATLMQLLPIKAPGARACPLLGFFFAAGRCELR